ncbi:MAG TPA: tRNA (adenosine(37)-N6)-threonylcarbamoyltransferase complex ATPase subunit type 1 TsaE [Acidimicrobiia bacterium]|nr:tRNA (adenosine(37)-N6)-threonylcarbamoyltransferase complex ATPase subunit type 1 TsaE [Acidimicrobiia bacterium]
MKHSAPASGPTFEIPSGSPSETLAVGRRLAALMRPGDVVLLVGRLGAGKTLLASGIAEGCGVQEQITSPTFVLKRSYDGLIPVHHVDVYRLSSTGEFDDLDLFAEPLDGVVLIEWGNAVVNEVPDDHLVVEMIVEGDEQRRLLITPHGDWSTRSLEGLMQ